MFDPIHTAEATAHAVETTAPLTAVNMTTKEELLSRARAVIEASDLSLHDAAETLGLAQEEHSANQREMADAVGKSPAWVNALLKWRASGYKNESPFGPKTKDGRVQHAEQRARLRSQIETRPRGAAAAGRDSRRAEGAHQLDGAIEEIKKIVSASVFEDREREVFRRHTDRIWMGL